MYVICDQTGGILQGFLRLGRKHLFLYPVSELVAVAIRSAVVASSFGEECRREQLDHGL